MRQRVVALEEEEHRRQPERREDRVERRAQPVAHLSEPLRQLAVEAPRELHAADEVDVDGAEQERKDHPGERDQRPDRPQTVVRDRGEERHRVRLAHRQRRKMRVESPVARTPTHVRGEAEVIRDRIDVDSTRLRHLPCESLIRVLAVKPRDHHEVAGAIRVEIGSGEDFRCKSKRCRKFSSTQRLVWTWNYARRSNNSLPLRWKQSV